MDDQFNNLFTKFMEINNKIYQMQKKSVKFNNGSVLTTNRIHLIEAIGRNKGFNITELADILKLTRSAVSQQIPRLVDDGYVVRYQKDSNDKEHLIKLTDKGEYIFKEHDKMHKEMNMEIIDDLHNFSNKDLEKFDEILSIIDFYLDKFKDEFR